MPDSPLKSLRDYSRFVAELLDDPKVERTTVALWSDSRYTGIAEGEVFFSNGIRLRMREEIDFAEGVPPEIKRNRIPAPGLGFEQPNLPVILQEIEGL